MKKTVIFLVIFSLLCTGSVLAADKKNPKPGHGEQRIFKLSGDNPWLDTGIILRPGDTVQVKAFGEVCFSNGEGHSCVSPDGYNQTHYQADYIGMDFRYCGDPDESINHAALIGKDANGMFLLGSQRTISGKKGKFYIGINDCSFKTEYYNTGAYNVTVKVIRAR